MSGICEADLIRLVSQKKRKKGREKQMNGPNFHSVPVDRSNVENPHKLFRSTFSFALYCHARFFFIQRNISNFTFRSSSIRYTSIRFHKFIDTYDGVFTIEIQQFSFLPRHRNMFTNNYESMSFTFRDILIIN